MSRVFWVIIVLMVAAATHLSYVLFVPRMVFNRSLQSLTGASPENLFFVLTPEAQVQLFPTLPLQSVVGLCKYNLTTGPVILNAAMPSGYWTLTVYTRTGKEFYALNDQQSGTAQFSVQLLPARSAIEFAIDLFRAPATEQENPVTNLGWTVESKEATGLAVFWVPVADQLMRKATVASMSGTTCGPKK